MKYKILLFLFLLFLLVSCQQELLPVVGDSGKGCISFSITPMKSGNTNLFDNKGFLTKAALAAEDKVNRIDMVFFDALTKAYITTYTQGLVNIADFAPTLPTSVRGKACNIYFLANLKTAPSGLVGTTEDDFKLSRCGLTTLTQSEVATYGIPMSGSLLNFAIPSDGIIANAPVTLTRLLARVNIVYTKDVSAQLTVTSLQVCNVPSITPYYSPETVDPASYYSSISVSNLDAELNPASGTTYTYYIPANRRGDGNPKNTDPRLKLGTNITTPNATNVLIISPNYIYILYLGGDDCNNYDVLANTQYTVNASIKGISQSDMRVTKIEFESNCYIVAPGGSINIPISRARNSQLPATVLAAAPADLSVCTASIYWNTDVTVTANAAQATSSTITIEKGGSCAKGFFTVNGVREGNAVVVLKDTSGKILWSWHIWVTSANLIANANTTPVTGPTASYVWMDRNLGAMDVAGSGKTFAVTAGMMYQWGRKDPFLPAINSSNVVMPIAGTGNIDLTKGTPASGQPYLPVNGTVVSSDYAQLLLSINNPMLYLSAWVGSTGVTIYTGSTSWGGAYKGDVKFIYDPCPLGWRVPSAVKSSTSYAFPWATFLTPTAGTVDGTTASPIFNNATGNGAYGDWGTYGKYPASGYRNTAGAFAEVGTYGFYFSGSTAGPGISYLLFSSGNVFGGSANIRASALPVRCVQE